MGATMDDEFLKKVWTFINMIFEEKNHINCSKTVVYMCVTAEMVRYALLKVYASPNRSIYCNS
jgi:hypothetical protein